MEFSEGKYTIQGLNVLDITQQFGTPLYVYDAEKIVSQIKSLKTAYSGLGCESEICCKALTNVSILKLIRNQGVGIEVVSLQEAQLAMKAGFTVA
jgi:diaminopimelate decarboxylase